MDVDLVVPEFPPAHWNFAFAMDVEGSAYSHPPLGALTLAAHTPSDVTVRVLDECVKPIDLDATAPLVGISAMYIQRKRAFEIADALRARGRTVVIGGGLAAALPDECASHADVVFLGEAEETWPRFLDEYREGRHERVYRAKTRFEMEHARTPRYDLLEMGNYSTGSIQASRGCPFQCEFCDVPQFDGNRSRTKSLAQVMTEVRALWDMGLDSIFFVDDHFLGNRRFAKELLQHLAAFQEEIGHRLIFYCQATLNVAADEELLELLYRAGFRRLFIGIESDDPIALKGVNKAHNTLMSVEESVRRIQRWNIVVWCALLVGFDQDTDEVFDRYARFAQRAGVGMIIPGILQAVPGTAYHERMKREERLVPLRNRYVGGQAGSLDSLLVTNVEPRNMSHDALIAGYRRLSRTLYQYDDYADRVIAFLEAGEMPDLSPTDLRRMWQVRGILKRTLGYYLGGDVERRRFFWRIARHLVRTRLHRADEAIFHLVIYKHLRTFYLKAADAETPLADDLERLPSLSVAV
jgi:radical SAM superfamily enzyme YgiQ (UPF0313 family)